jgi:hypothetical protein
MAKNQKNGGTVVAVRAPKAKTPAQKARAEANMKAAQERLARHQALQKAAHEMRTVGFMGTDADLIEMRERLKEEAAARAFVNKALAGEHGEKIAKWLGRCVTGDACQIALRVKNYMRTQGWR